MVPPQFMGHKMLRERMFYYRLKPCGVADMMIGNLEALHMID